jgi:hypothetical protein
MKYYIYISDAKVDMLYPQIPKPILKKIASSLSIDLKLFGAEVSVGAKSNQADEIRYAKVKIVAEYIEKHLDVGTVDAPSTYFKGTLPMKWGPPFENEEVAGSGDMVYFGGFTQRTILGLAGSMGHVISGNKGSTFEMGVSHLYALFTILASDPQKPISDLPDTEDNYYIDQAFLGVQRQTWKMRGPKQQLEFLAKTLLQGPLAYPFHPSFKATQSYVVLGTPIYVALAD